MQVAETLQQAWEAHVPYHVPFLPPEMTVPVALACAVSLVACSMLTMRRMQARVRVVLRARACRTLARP